VRNFRLQAAHNLLDEALMALPPTVLVRRVVGPLLGRLQRDGDDAAARFAASLVEVRLLAHGRGWQSGSGPRVLLACVPRDEYVLDLIAFGLLLADRRCRIAYLGASTPTSMLRTATREGDVAALVLSAEVLDLRPREVMQLRLVGHHVPTFALGSACEPLARTSGAGVLPLDAVAAADLVTGAARGSPGASEGASSP
jgi:MerR family transcriptional regulator, light-induced transcriptional regulator